MEAMSYLVLVAGIALLVFFGDLLVRGAVGLAERLSIPPVVIGLTVVAFGTSAPELVVSLKAALTGSPGMALGNVIGSNITNMLLVVGLPAMVMATSCDEPHLQRHTFYMLCALALFTLLCWAGPLGFWHGAMLLAMMALYLAESAHRAYVGRPGAGGPSLEQIENIDGVPGVPHKLTGIVLMLGTGLVGLPLGGHVTVEAARAIALGWGVSDAVIGLTVVAIGTSLPELATTLIAAIRHQAGLALGNVLGSTIFNVLAITGITAVVVPLPVAERFLHFDLWVMLAAALTVLPFVMGRRSLNWAPGAVFVSVYCVYLYALVGRAGSFAAVGL